MQRIDSMNTTALDGRACELCGDDATGTDTIDNGHRTIPTCDHCHEYAIVTCDKCAERGEFNEFFRFAPNYVLCAACAEPILRDVGMMVPPDDADWAEAVSRIEEAKEELWHRTPILVRQGLLAEVDCRREKERDS